MISKLVFFSFLLAFSDAAVQLGCKSDPMPPLNNRCPDGYTEITNGMCCPDGDVYIIGATTTLAPTTTTTASSDSCQDKLNPKTGISDCPGMASYCQNPAYKSVMKDQCPKTCGYCTSSPTSSTCQDKINPSTGRSDCPGMASYCQNPVYHDVMKDQCPKTCGYCT